MKIISLYTLLFCLFCTETMAQTVLYSDPAGQSHTNTDGPVLDVTPTVDISNCTSIEFTIDYSFPGGWEGGGNLEYLDECCMDCDGDPENPTQLGCLQNMTCSGMVGCWDFMWIQFFVDGQVEAENLIGDEGTTDAESNGTFSFLFCVEENEEAYIEITNQNWAASETNIYSNVMILCWEGQPTIEELDPVCGVNDLDLIGDAEDPSIVVSYFWTTDGSANIDDEASQITFANGVMDGDEFTLTTTDVNNCQGTETVEAMVSGFDVSLQGGGELCDNECTDDDTDMIIEISGGVPLYQLSFEVNGFPVPFAPATDVDAIFRICNDPDATFPEYDDNTDPPQLIIPSSFFPIDIELISIIDDNGCAGNIMGGSINYDIIAPPEINNIASPFYCVENGETIDLTIMDEDLDPGNFDVLWFEDEDLEEPIVNPGQYNISNGLTVYAVVDNGECFSEPVEINLNALSLPEIEVIQSPIIDCYTSQYVLPPLDEVVDITNGINPGYYLDADGDKGPVTTIDPDEFDEIFVYDSAGPDCSVSVVIPLVLSPAPEIESPLGQIIGCNSIVLPLPQGTNFNNFEYNTEEDGSGFSFSSGDVISAIDNIDVLYLIVSNSSGCTATEELEIELSGTADYTANIPALLCDSLLLPPIFPFSATVAYYTASQGMGTQLLPGDVLYAPFNGSLFIYDTNQDMSCPGEDTIMINFVSGPNPIFPSDTSACEFIVLPQFQGTFGPNIRYAQFPISNPMSTYYPGDTLSFSQTLYVLDTIGSCQYYDSMVVTIFNEPFIGRDSTLIICEGFESSSFNFMSLLSNPTRGGEWQYPNIPDFNPTDSTNVFLDIIPPGIYDFQYTIEDSICGLYASTVSLEVITRPYGGENNSISLCTSSGLLNFMELISFPDTGGNWSQVSGPESVNFIDSTQVDLSGISAGNYGFLYIIDGEAITEFCEPESSSLFINLGSGVNAGQDNSFSACQGDIIDLLSLLSSDADTNGFFEGDNIVFSGNTWNTSASMTNETYLITYIVLSNDSNCPGDTAFFNIELLEQLSAGELVTPAVACEDGLINLNDYVINSSGSGVFSLQSDPQNEITDGIWMLINDEDFYYIVEGNANCLPDTLAFSIQAIQAPSYNAIFSGSGLCAGNIDDFIRLTVNPVRMDTFLYNFEVYDVPTGNLIFQVDSLIESSFSLNIISSEKGPLLSNDTLYLSNIPGSYRLELLAYDKLGLCPDDQNVQTTINILNSYEETIDVELCEGDSFEFDGTFYTMSQVLNFPIGNSGCDSIININITNYPQIQGNFSGVFCTGDTIQILGNSYFQNTQILESFAGASSFGCDSLIAIDIQFESAIFNNITEVLCPEEELTINNIIYDINNPSGTDTLISINGCDSIININLSFFAPSTFMLQQDICGNESVTVGGDIYDSTNLFGTSVLANASVNGCDSAVMVNLTLLQESFFLLEQSICENESIIVGTDTYNSSNLSGTTILTGQAFNGCDSIVDVSLTILNPSTFALDANICNGQTITVGSDVYSAGNLSGTTILTGQAFNGCDSIVDVSLTIINPSTFALDANICNGQTITVGSDVYSASNLSGTTILTGQAFNGCDSIVDVSLTILNPSTFALDANICNGQTITVGSDVYSASNLSGTTILTGQAFNGCDSIVNVSLTVVSSAEFDLQMEICPGEEIVVGNDIYDQDNLTGTTIFVGQSVFGCDSIVNVNLSILQAIADINVASICPEEAEGNITIASVDNLGFPLSIFLNNELSTIVGELPIDLSVEPGIYNLMIIDAQGCSYEETLELEVLIVDNLSILVNETTVNNYNLSFANNVLTSNIEWLISTGETFNNANSIDIQINQDTEVILNGSTAAGCSIADTILLLYEVPKEPSLFYIPNVFDVSNPGNDEFSVLGEDVELLEMSIYDRWGNLVYFNDGSTGEAFTWDGRKNDALLEQGVYVYKIILINDELQEQTIIGDVTLLR